MFVDVDEIVKRSPDTTFFEFCGRRGCGKTFGVKKLMLETFLETGRGFCYIRRQKSEVRPFALNDLFSDVFEKCPDFLDAFRKKYETDDFSIRALGGFFWTCVDGKKIERIGVYSAISQAGSFKGFPHNNIGTIFFDEVVTDSGYYHGDEEPEFFNKILYTIARKENSDIRVFLAGNPDQNIELCPYFTNLKIDYQKLSGNTLYYFNSKFHGKIRKNNILFVKMTGGVSDDEYLNLRVAGVFGDVEATMSFSGEVATSEYKKITPELLARSTPLVELAVETPIITESGFPKKVYVYIMEVGALQYLLILSHEKIGNCEKINCTYDALKVSPDKGRNNTFRFALSLFPKVEKSLTQTISENMIFTDSDFTAQTFFNIYNNYKK